MSSRLTCLCLALAAVTLHRTWTYAYGCSEPSSCRTIELFGIPTGLEDIISLQDSNIACGSEEEETDKIFTLWNWTTASGCDMRAMRMNYTCNLTDANGSLIENLKSPDYRNRIRGSSEESVGTLSQSLSWTVNVSDWYSIQCQIGGKYELEYNEARCALWLPQIWLNVDCTGVTTTEPPVVISPTTTLQSSITASQVTETVRTVIPSVPLTTVIPSVLSTTTESESSENSQVTLRIATITTSVIVLVAAISVFVAVNLLSLVRRRAHKASTSKTFDVFTPDYNPVDPAKATFSDDVVSLTSKIYPLKRLEDEGATHTVVTIVDTVSEGSSLAYLDIDGHDST